MKHQRGVRLFQRRLAVDAVPAAAPRLPTEGARRTGAPFGVLALFFSLRVKP
jgi:hypothetical protein